MTEADQMEISRISAMQPPMKWHREKSRNLPVRSGNSRYRSAHVPTRGEWGMYQYRCGRLFIVPNLEKQDYDLYLDDRILAEGISEIDSAKMRAKPFAFGLLIGSEGRPFDYDKYNRLKYSENWLEMYKVGYEEGRKTRSKPVRTASSSGLSLPLKVGDGGQFGSLTPRIVKIYSDSKMRLVLGNYGQFILDGYSTKDFSEDQWIVIPGEFEICSTEKIGDQTFVVVSPIGRAGELKLAPE